MKETKTEAISSAILCILSGLVLCIFNVSILTTITRVIGCIFLVIAILFLYTYFKKRNSTTLTTLVLGIFLLSVGLYMSFEPRKFISILPMLVGILLIINSLSHFQKVLLLKDNGFEQWKVNLAGAIFILVVGIVLLMKPIQSLDFIFSLTGSFPCTKWNSYFWINISSKKRIYKSKHTLLIICIVANIFSGFFCLCTPIFHRNSISTRCQ